MSVAAVILAAGASRRLGRPKQNLILAGETLLQRTIRVAREASLFPVIVVSRAANDYANVLDSGIPVKIVINAEPDEGMASSIRCGIADASSLDVAGAVILACDQPTLRADHLRSLVAIESRITGSAYAGSVGVPAYFPMASFPLLLQLRGDVGARKLLIDAYSVSAEDLTLDIDTTEDLIAARELLEQDSVQS